MGSREDQRGPDGFEDNRSRTYSQYLMDIWGLWAVLSHFCRKSGGLTRLNRVFSEANAIIKAVATDT